MTSDFCLAWATFYLFASFNSVLPWETCNFEEWADYRCELPKTNCTNAAIETQGPDGLCYNTTFVMATNVENIERNRSTVVGFWNESLASHYGVSSVLATEQYWQ